MVFFQRSWMCDEGGFEGWKGRWKNRALFEFLFLLSFMVVIVFSRVTWSRALISALPRSGRMVVGE